MSRNAPFKTVGSLSPGKSAFDLSYNKLYTCDMGQIIPVCCDELVPTDSVEIQIQAVVRMQPLVAPILHPIEMSTYFFFIPNRIMWNAKTRELLTETGDWVDFITGGEDGANADKIPTWTPPNPTVKDGLWDYLGFPTGIDMDGYDPVDWPRRGYNMIYNWNFRDQKLVSEVALTNEDILIAAWHKDYYTSAMTDLQLGTAPALPITGTTTATWDQASFVNSGAGANVAMNTGASTATMHINDATGAVNMHDLFEDNRS